MQRSKFLQQCFTINQGFGKAKYATLIVQHVVEVYMNAAMHEHNTEFGNLSFDFLEQHAQK